MSHHVITFPCYHSFVKNVNIATLTAVPPLAAFSFLSASPPPEAVPGQCVEHVKTSENLTLAPSKELLRCSTHTHKHTKVYVAVVCYKLVVCGYFELVLHKRQLVSDKRLTTNLYHPLHPFLWVAF